MSRRHGIVGALGPRSGRVLGTHRSGEAVGTSFTTDDISGVFVVTDKAH